MSIYRHFEERSDEKSLFASVIHAKPLPVISNGAKRSEKSLFASVIHAKALTRHFERSEAQ